ncbi:MAG: Tll0287-like domain-containing protein [Candidatus Scalindua sp.]
MLKKSMFIGLLLVFAVFMTDVQAFTVDKKELEKQSELIAKLLVSCRAVIAKNLDLINDPEKGDKGFTGDVYISKVKEHYKNATGIEVSESDVSSSVHIKKALGILLVSAKYIINESQRVINMKVKGLNNIIPAVIGRRTSYRYTSAMGAGYYLKQTSLKYRNPANHPDILESKYLKEFEEPGYPKGKGKGEIIANSDGSKIYRYMLPVYIEPPCLKCHGGPKGVRDLVGRIKEGYKEGEVRGGISVMLPYPSGEFAQEREEDHVRGRGSRHGGLRSGR